MITTEYCSTNKPSLLLILHTPCLLSTGDSTRTRTRISGSFQHATHIALWIPRHTIRPTTDRRILLSRYIMANAAAAAPVGALGDSSCVLLIARVAVSIFPGYVVSAAKAGYNGRNEGKAAVLRLEGRMAHLLDHRVVCD